MKTLTVATQMQKDLFELIFLPEIRAGFWRSIRNNDSYKAWDGVEVKIGPQLGLVNIDICKSYNFTNTEFFGKHKDRILTIARRSDPNIKLSSVKKQLVMLSHIIGGRIEEIGGPIIKLKRGGKPKTVKPKIEKPQIIKAQVIFKEPTEQELKILMGA